MFLPLVLIGLIAVIALLGWGSTYIFGKLEPALLGSLVGAAGTIFAGCIAYSAAVQSLKVAETSAEEGAKQRVENEKLQKVFQLRQATTELSQLREALTFIDKFVGQFDGASEIGPRDYVAFFNDVYLAGGISPFMASVPENFRARIQQEFMRFQMLQNAFNTTINRPPNDPGAAEQRLALSRNIRERLSELRKLRGEVDEDIRHREREVDAMNRPQP